MEIVLSGEVGRLTASYRRAEDSEAPIAVVFHDSPERGGSMNDPVAYALFLAFANNGFSVLRFNFRGAGGSEGEFDGGEGELADSSSVVDWLQERHEFARQFWLAGDGFGAFVAMQMLMRRVEASNYISVCPPLKKFDFSFFQPVPVDGLVVSRGGDANGADAFPAFVKSINKRKTSRAELAVIDG
ncbi:MAG: alpha/beta hydrolase, partial [Rickettsiales bacterium]|nr:alpha/beta hydrolase [Rickettsiales bacterium]